MSGSSSQARHEENPECNRKGAAQHRVISDDRDLLTALAVAILYLAHIRPYVVLSGSMEPAIPVHSVCFVNENIPFAQITPGEVISFRMEGGMLVTHRVSAVQDGRCTTKGDANSIEDAVPVTADNYIGKTVAVIDETSCLVLYYS